MEEVEHKENKEGISVEATLKSEAKEVSEEAVKLGSIELASPLGIGTWAWGDSKTWGYNTFDKTFNDQTIEEAYTRFMDSGVNFWDTAEIYGGGASETLLGGLITKHKDKYSKLPAIVATKFIPLPWKFTASSFKNSLQASLTRLQTSKIDLYQIHGPSFSLRRVEFWAECLAEAVKEGKIKEIGVSNYNLDQIKRTQAVLAQHKLSIVSNQIEYSLLRNNPEKNGTLKYCQENGIKILAYSPLGMGKLTGKYSKNNLPQGDRKFANQPWDKIDNLVDKLKEIGTKRGKTPAQVAINWCICKGTIPLVGVKNEKQAQDNLGAIGWRLTSEEVADLDKLAMTGEKSFWQHDDR